MGKVNGSGDALMDKWVAAMTRHQQTGKLWQPGGVKTEHGPTGKADKKAQPRDRVTRPRLTQLKRKSERSTAVNELRSVLKKYKKHGHLVLGNDGGLTCLGAAGKLDPRTVSAELRRAGIDEKQFCSDLFNIMRINVRDEVEQLAREADATLGRIQRDPATFLGALAKKPTAAREKLLRSLGIDEKTARSIARSPASSAEALRAAAGNARQRLSAVRKEGNLGALFDLHTRSMFDLFEPVVKRLGIRTGSYADQARKAGLARCARAEKVDSAMKMAVGIVGSFAGGFLTQGLWLSAGTSLGSSVITGAPDVLSASHDLAAARGAEAMGVAGKGAVERAKRRFEGAVIGGAKGVLLGTVGGGLNGALGKGASLGAKVGAHGAPVGADVVNRATDPLVGR